MPTPGNALGWHFLVNSEALTGRHSNDYQRCAAPSGLRFVSLIEPRAALPMVACPGLVYCCPVGAEPQNHNFNNCASGWLLQVRLPFELDVSNLQVGELFLKTLQQFFFVESRQFTEHCGIGDADLQHSARQFEHS